MHIAPRETQRFLKRFGGLTPYGLPKWRLSVGSEVMVKEVVSGDTITFGCTAY